MPHLIALTEPWLTESDDLSTFNIAGYQPIECRSCSLKMSSMFYASIHLRVSKSIFLDEVVKLLMFLHEQKYDVIIFEDFKKDLLVNLATN